MTTPGIGDRRGCRAELRLQLVGGKRFERRNTGDQHDRDGDEPATAGNGINETGKNSSKEQQEEELEGEVGQGMETL